MPKGVISTQDLADLFRSYQAAMGLIADMPDPIEEKLARVFTDAGGQELVIPFMPVSNAPAVRNPGEERPVTDSVEEYKCTIKHVPIYPASVRQLYDVIMSSSMQFGMFRDMLDEFIATAPGIWRELLAKKMNDARTGIEKSYNGQNFISLTHPINPTKVLGNQSNYLPNTKMDKAGAGAALRLIDNMKGHDGRRLNRASKRSLVLACPNEDTYGRALEVWTAEYIAQAVGAFSAAVIKNQLAKYEVEVVKFAELDDFSSKASYLLDVTSAKARAFAVSKARNVTAYFSGLIPEDEVRRKFLSVEAGMDAFGGAGVMLHQKVICIEEP